MLPGGWHSQSAMLPAEGERYGGDFLVADLGSNGVLQAVLVDVCGHGAAAYWASLRFAGALETLLLTVGPEETLDAANRYLLRQPSTEAFATAVQLVIDLSTGDYRIRSAGHPPALRWLQYADRWQVDNARGTALGAVEVPEFEESGGVLTPGDALLFYTDGVVETRRDPIDDGIVWLAGAAADAVRDGFEGAAATILDQVERGEDDRAVLILGRHGI